MSVTVARPPLRAHGRSLRALVGSGLVAAGLVGLFFAYLAMSRTVATDADGASMALQAWDVLHGNARLTGWTGSDVACITVELPVLVLVEAWRGLGADVVHTAAAILYPLLVLGVAVLAQAGTRGREALTRIAVALAPMLVPAAGFGTMVLLLSPDHTGTSIPLLLALILIDRAASVPRWLPFAVTAVLTIGQVNDPLLAYVGVVPIVLVYLLRQPRAGRPSREWWNPSARLAVAAVASTVLARLVLFTLRAAGGLYIHSVPAGIGLARLPRNIALTSVAVSADFGGYLPDRHGPLAVVLGVIRILLLVVTAVVVGIVAVRLIRSRTPRMSFVDDVLVVAIVVNLGLFVGSTIPADAGSARQVSPVLFLGCAALGRFAGPRLAAAWSAGRRFAPIAVVALVLVAGGELAVRAVGSTPVPPEDHDVAQFLEDHQLAYGLGGFWIANNITLQTGGRVQVVPVMGAHDVAGYRWLSKSDWYDPTRHDARFVVIRTDTPPYGTEAGTVAQFGVATHRYEVGRAVILTYDRNLLLGLPAHCPQPAPSMAECPRPLL